MFDTSSSATVQSSVSVAQIFGFNLSANNGRNRFHVRSRNGVAVGHVPLLLHDLDMLVVALELDARLSEADDSTEEVEFLGVSVRPSCDLYLEFILLSKVVAEPLELVTFT